MGEGGREGDVDGLRAGAGSADDDERTRRARPDSSRYGDMLLLERRLYRRISCSFSSSSISTSFISSPTPSSGDMARPSRKSLTPKTRNRIAAAKLVNRFGKSVGTAWPKRADRTVMKPKAASAAVKTTVRSCLMAISAAIRKVLSPISEKMIMVNESMKE